MRKTNRRAVVQQLIRLVVTGILLAPCILFGTLLQGSPAEGWSWTGVVCAALFFASVLVFFGWMLYAAHRYSRTAWFRIGGFAVLFVWVFVTLFCFSHLDEGIVEGGLAYRLLEVFNRASTVFLSRGKDLAQGAGAGAVVNAWLLRLAIVGYLVSMMFSMMGRRVFNRLRVSLTCARHKNVFWGLSERELLLARSIVEGSCWDQVQFNLPVDKSCDPSSLARLMDLADEIDAFWMFVDFGRLSREKGCHHGGRHFFLGEDGHANLALANKVTEAFLDDPHACCETVLYVRVGDIDNEAMFSAWAHGVYERSAHLVRPVLVHEPEMIARKYVEQYPPLASKTLAERIDTSRATVREASCRTLLLGFDHTGRALLNAQLCQSGFILPDGRSPVAFPITVVDMVQARWDRYGLQAPEIVANRADHALDFKCLQVGMPAFESWFRDVHGAFDRIVFCLKGDGVNIREALRMRELLIQLGDVDKELIVRVESPALNESVRLRETDVLPLKYFGKLDDIYSVGFMNGDPVDRIARYLNWQWNVNRDLEQDGAVARLIHERDKMQIKEQSDDVARYWEGSTYYERLSSRASAMAGLSFLRLLGLDWRPAGEVGADDVVVQIQEVNRRVAAAEEVLARTEHLRWCAYLRTRGYRRWDLVSPFSVEEVAARRRSRGLVPNRLAQQVAAFGAHAALVPYDELPALDLRLARAVYPEAAFREEDFVGKVRPRVAEGKCAASLQCKDFDIWSVFPEAVELAGYVFVSARSNAGGQVAVGSAGRPYRPARRRGLRLRAWLRWLCRGSDMDEESFERNVKSERKSLVLKVARWAAEAYRDVPEKNSRDVAQCAAFLSASLIEDKDSEFIRALEPDRTLTVFWFADLISSYRMWRRGLGGGRTRYPYVYDHGSGIIQPLSRVLSRRKRRRLARELGIRGRRLDFDYQPDFVAHVFDSPVLPARRMVVFRGTASGLDWYDDVIQLFGRLPGQFRIAADLVRAVCESTDRNLLLVGHSKGGGLVQYALMRCGLQRWTGRRRLDGMTFNSQRLSPLVLANLRRQVETNLERLKRCSPYASEHIENFRTRRDIVSGWLALGTNLLGRVYAVGGVGRLSIRKHRIAEIIRAIERSLGPSRPGQAVPGAADSHGENK